VGKILQIRVSAYTYRPEDVEERYPRLTALAWPEPDTGAPGPEPKTGLLELVEALSDQARFGGWSKELVADMEPVLAKAKDRKARLEKALADWDAHTADSLSYEIEDALASLEKMAPKSED
jgi:hypothetical protein